MLAIRCTLLRDEFEGGRPDDPRSAEWPPSWMRLFSALVSVAGEGNDDLLRRLEEADPPHIDAPEAVLVSRAAFVPTNRILSETRHTQLYARTNGERQWARAIPREPRVTYLWPRLDLGDAEVERLAALCRRVPYFGRSTSPALVEVVDHPGEATALIPETATTPDRFELHTVVRAPFPGALRTLREAHHRRQEGDDSTPVWEIGQGVGYGTFRDDREEETILSGPYRRMLVLRLEGRQLDGRHAARVAHFLRRTILSRADAHLPCLHGHHDGDVVQCAFLPLPMVGAEHADGHLLGVAIALPDLSPADERVIVEAVGADELSVTAGPLGVLRMRPVSPLDAQRRPWALQPRRWQDPSRHWTTALPMVFDRFPGRRKDLTNEVVRSVVNARLPEPTRVAWSTQPFISGGVRMTALDTLRRPGRDPVRPFRHVTIEFDQPVRGPVVIGSMRHYGLGLCVPMREDRDDDE